MKRILIPLFSSVFLFSIFYFLNSVFAFVGPTCSAGGNCAAIVASSSGNISIGTSSIPGTNQTKLFIVGSSTDSTYFAIRAVDKNVGPLFLVRNDGKIALGTSTFDTTSTVSLGGTVRFSDGTYQSTAGATLPVNAVNIEAGNFGQNYGGGNFAFPAALSVGTSTGSIPSGSRFYVASATSGILTALTGGNVGIGTTAPGYALEVGAGGTSILRADTTAANRAVYITDGTLPSYLPHPNFIFSVSGADSDYVGMDFNARTSGAVPFISLRRADAQKWTFTVDSSNELNFRRGDAVAASSLTLLSGGNVGIGISTPGAKLDVTGSGGFWSTSNWGKGIELSDGVMLKWEANAGSWRHGIGGFADGLYFSRAQCDDSSCAISHDMMIGDNGSVGIGTTAPGTNAGSLIPSLDVVSSSRGGIGIGGSATADGIIGDLNFYNTAIGTTDDRIAIIIGERSGANNSGRIALWTANAGAFGRRMTISPAGDVGIGITVPGAQLDLSTDSARKLTTNTWSTGSDIRIKTNVSTVSDALEIIRQMRPVKYRYNADFLKAHPDVKDVDYYNFIAQEYQQVFPNSVMETDGLLYLNPSHMLPYAIAGIKELDESVAKLKTENDALKARIEALEVKLR